jgi:hypothetical protein
VEQADDPAAIPGYRLAVLAETLYLVNLMLAPGLGFLLLAWLWREQRAAAPPLARCHLEQTFAASLWAGVLILVVTGVAFALGGFASAWTWVIVIIYFTMVHSSLVILGVLGLARAAAGRPFVFPLVGRRGYG